jgi:hypothetical protein
LGEVRVNEFTSGRSIFKLKQSVNELERRREMGEGRGDTRV